MTENAEVGHNVMLHQFHHDIQSCLHVISMRMEMLKDLQGDEVRFADVCEGIQKERRKAANLLNEFLVANCSACK